jgi:predicted small secreted protein
LALGEFPHLLETMTMRTLVLLTMLAASLAVSACNTVAGAGKDVKSAGSAVTDTANDAKH